MWIFIIMFKELYWKLVPYDWRPGQIIYALKCYLWKRYTTYKPRYLNHQWHDKDTILEHMMMEILSQFIEKECSPGDVEWYGDWVGNKGIYDGVERYHMDVMKEIYKWWHEVYNGTYPEDSERIWSGYKSEENFEAVEGGGYLLKPPSERNRKIMDQVRELEDKIEKQLDDYLITLLKLRRYMWT
jgi:hypothetical protein